MPAQPPALAAFRWRALRPGEVDHELIWLSVTAATLAMSAWWLQRGFPWPHCFFKAVTGCPCAGCGATRAMLQLSRGHLRQAFALNPLATLGACGLAAFDLYALLVLCLPLPRLRPLCIQPKTANRLRFLVLAAMVMNWAWVIWRGN